jgi:hypothetical protein
LRSCVFFVALFLLGVGLFVSGLVYDVMHGGISVMDASADQAPSRPEDRNLARYLEVGGIAVVFGSVFAAAGWGFYTRKVGDDDER